MAAGPWRAGAVRGPDRGGVWAAGGGRGRHLRGAGAAESCKPPRNRCYFDLLERGRSELEGGRNRAHAVWC